MGACVNKKIYIVEDNEHNFQALKRVFAEVLSEADVIHAPGGYAVIDMVNKTKPDLILMDISMPDMDGVEATTWIRKKYSKKQLPIIAMTGRDAPDDKKRVFDAGCNEYLTKPFSVSQMMEKVTFYLGGSAR
jgi:CheY-like chemotaxis protein